MEYDLDMDTVVQRIKDEGAKSVCIQLADGLKPKAEDIKNTIERETDAVVYIWLGSCYGACDMPKPNVDLLISFGHAQWKFDKKFGQTEWK